MSNSLESILICSFVISLSLKNGFYALLEQCRRCQTTEPKLLLFVLQLQEGQLLSFSPILTNCPRLGQVDKPAPANSGQWDGAIVQAWLTGDHCMGMLIEVTRVIAVFRVQMLGWQQNDSLTH